MEQPKKLRISSAGTHSKILVAAAFILFLLRNASPQDAVPLDAGHFDYSATAALEVKEISVQQRDCVRYRIRHQQRQRREAVPVPVVALVGYTNAGKSTLSNALTEAGVLESARMFATLDPNSGSCGFLHAARYCSPIPSASSVIFPTHLLRAFAPPSKRSSEPKFFSTSRTPPARSAKSRKLRLKKS